MQGLYVKFTPTGDITLEPQIVEGNLNLLRQNAAVILLTTVGTDKIYTSKGTNLLVDATFGKITDINSASHAANFAALRVKNYLTTYEYEENLAANAVYADIKLKATTASNGMLKFDFTFDTDTDMSGFTWF